MGIKFGARERMIASTVCVFLTLTAAVIGLTIGLRTPAPPNGGSPYDEKPPPPLVGNKPYESEYRTYRYSSVTTDTNICSKIGVDILGAKGGSAVDAAIASMFCVGLVNCHSTGIGGGHFATIYERPRGATEKQFYSLQSRERAPLNATRDMFVNTTGLSSKGGLAIAVPGEVRGHYESWKMFGRLPWRDLIMPSVDLCNNGFIVEKDLSGAINQYETEIRADPNLRELFVKPDGKLITEGDLLVNDKLGTTLQRIADDPFTFYNGSLAEDIVEDIKEYGGIVSLEDLEKYWSSIKIPLNVSLANGGYHAFNPPPPSSGVVLSFILNILDGFNLTDKDLGSSQETLTRHRIVEAFKFSYAKRSLLGDEDFVNITELLYNLTSDAYAEDIRTKIDDLFTHDVWYYEPNFDMTPDSGTAHLNVLAQDGAAVAMTGTVNLFFGSNCRGRRTGIIFNDEMDDFSTPGTTNYFGVPASPSNYIVPGKMPMSSMSPTIISDANNRVVFLSGASGGTRITTQTAAVAMNSLWFKLNLKDSTDTARIHHQLMPNELVFENNLDETVLTGLKKKNHTTVPSTGIAVVGSIRSTCQYQFVRRGNADYECIEAVSDARKGGVPDGF